MYFTFSNLFEENGISNTKISNHRVSMQTVEQQKSYILPIPGLPSLFMTMSYFFKTCIHKSSRYSCHQRTTTPRLLTMYSIYIDGSQIPFNNGIGRLA